MQLRHLRVSGAGVEPADLSFRPGFNVVSGASNTGKSYILRCLDFVLGATRFSKEIEEARGYERILLEIIDKNGVHHTLERSLSGGHILHYFAPIKDVGASTPVETLRWKADRSAKPDISTFVLNAAGIPIAQVRKKRGQNARLTLRQIDHLFIIDETSIIAERSPLFDEAGFSQRTYSESAFNFFITGKDDTGLASAEDTRLAEAARRAKIEVVDALLNNAAARVAALPPLDPALGDLLAAVRAELDRLSELVKLRTAEIDVARADRAEAIAERQKAETQALALQELIARFELLDARYQSDLERLEFVADGHHYFLQLDTARCPICGQSLDAESAEHLHSGADGLVEQVQEAARAEALKIVSLRKGLSGTVEDLRARQAEETARAAAALRRREDAERRLATELGPALETASTALQFALKRHEELTTRRLEEQRLSELKGIRADLEPVFMLRSPDETRRLDRGATHQLSLAIEELLREWSWPGPGRVQFDPEERDIVVDGKPRQSNGKGVRAILHAAFAIALMRYTLANGLPHPGFVVLDSPLTTYKQGQTLEAGDEVVHTIEQSFFESLAATPPDQQIIVLENKTPDSSLIEGFNYVEFSGATGLGRRGFFPSAK